MKLKYLNLLFLLFVFGSAQSQFQWNWTQMANMPMRTSNNAVASFNSITGQSYLYSFGGIDSTKTSSGIHQRTFSMNFLSNSWTEIAPLPDTLGKIAMGANCVGGKIYIIGGYHVFPNGNEISSNKVHVFNPNLEVFEADGAPIPVPIDDHVQCVYKDSLIFVVTGWSNTTNKADVQIYDPALNQWTAGTSLPNNFNYKAFGASGYIIGDTLYYFGGVTSASSFIARDYMRKGYINPNDPTDITWSTMTPAPGGAGYRSACSASGQTVFWIGGASVGYNFDGIAYNGSGGVQPDTRILHLNSPSNSYQNNASEPFGVMDLRGIGELGSGRWLICGGMDSNQVVTNRTFLLTSPSLNLKEEKLKETFFISYTEIGVNVHSKELMNYQLVSMDGKTVKTISLTENWEIPFGDFPGGVYFIQTDNYSQKIILN
ncbi:MAG: hypothetical protein QNK75_03330 [Crocinitomicaceae bacterium]|jgi:N-acetylneuraminic acid mutarotase